MSACPKMLGSPTSPLKKPSPSSDAAGSTGTMAVTAGPDSPWGMASPQVRPGHEDQLVRSGSTDMPSSLIVDTSCERVASLSSRKRASDEGGPPLGTPPAGPPQPVQYMWLKKQHQLPMAPSRLLHIPSMVAEESLDLDECVRSGVTLQVEADGVVDPSCWLGALSIYKNSSGYHYYRLAGTRQLSTKYQGLTIQGWAAVDTVTVRMYLSTDPTAPTPEPPKRQPAAAMVYKPSSPLLAAPSHKRKRCSTNSDEDIPCSFNTGLDLRALLAGQSQGQGPLARTHAAGNMVEPHRRAHGAAGVHGQPASQHQPLGTIAVPPSDHHQVVQLMNGQLVHASMIAPRAGSSLHLGSAPGHSTKAQMQVVMAGDGSSHQAVDPQLPADLAANTSVVMSAATLNSLLANAAQAQPQVMPSMNLGQNLNAVQRMSSGVQMFVGPDGQLLTAHVPASPSASAHSSAGQLPAGLLQALHAGGGYIGATQQVLDGGMQASGPVQVVQHVQQQAQPMVVLLQPSAHHQSTGPYLQSAGVGGSAGQQVVMCVGPEMWAGNGALPAGIIPAGAQIMWCSN